MGDNNKIELDKVKDVFLSTGKYSTVCTSLQYLKLIFPSCIYIYILKNNVIFYIEIELSESVGFVNSN